MSRQTSSYVFNLEEKDLLFDPVLFSQLPKLAQVITAYTREKKIREYHFKLTMRSVYVFFQHHYKSEFIAFLEKYEVGDIIIPLIGSLSFQKVLTSIPFQISFVFYFPTTYDVRKKYWICRKFNDQLSPEDKTLFENKYFKTFLRLYLDPTNTTTTSFKQQLQLFQQKKIFPEITPFICHHFLTNDNIFGVKNMLKFIVHEINGNKDESIITLKDKDVLYLGVLFKKEKRKLKITSLRKMLRYLQKYVPLSARTKVILHKGFGRFLRKMTDDKISQLVTLYKINPFEFVNRRIDLDLLIDIYSIGCHRYNLENETIKDIYFERGTIDDPKGVVSFPLFESRSSKDYTYPHDIFRREEFGTEPLIAEHDDSLRNIVNIFMRELDVIYSSAEQKVDYDNTPLKNLPPEQRAALQKKKNLVNCGYDLRWMPESNVFMMEKFILLEKKNYYVGRHLSYTEDKSKPPSDITYVETQEMFHSAEQCIRNAYRGVLSQNYLSRSLQHHLQIDVLCKLIIMYPPVIHIDAFLHLTCLSYKDVAETFKTLSLGRYEMLTILQNLEALIIFIAHGKIPEKFVRELLRRTFFLHQAPPATLFTLMQINSMEMEYHRLFLKGVNPVKKFAMDFVYNQDNRLSKVVCISANIHDVVAKVGMIIPYSVAYEEYFMREIPYYNRCYQRILSGEPGKMLIDRTDHQLLQVVGGYIPFSSRQHLERKVQKMSLYPQRKYFFISAERKAINSETTLLTPTNDTSIPMLAFGTIDNYRCYEYDELLHCFKEGEEEREREREGEEREERERERDSGEGEGEGEEGCFAGEERDGEERDGEETIDSLTLNLKYRVNLKHPEDLRQRFTWKEIKDLQDLYSSLGKDHSLVKEVKEIFQKYSLMQQYVSFCQKLFSRLKDEEKIKMKNFFFSLLQTGMYLRRWKGEGFPYPYSKEETLGEQDQDLIFKNFARLQGMLDEMDDLTIKMFFHRRFSEEIFLLEEGSEEYVEDYRSYHGIKYFVRNDSNYVEGTYLMGYLLQLFRGEACIRVGSKICVDTSRYYLFHLFGEDPLPVEKNLDYIS